MNQLRTLNAQSLISDRGPSGTSYERETRCVEGRIGGGHTAVSLLRDLCGHRDILDPIGPRASIPISSGLPCDWRLLYNPGVILRSGFSRNSETLGLKL